MIDYKKWIKSRRVRLAILTWLSFIPDKLMVLIQYKIKMGFWPNLKNPKRFTEKLQCYKLFYRDPTMKICVDKYDVRGYIESLGLGYILNECYGVYNDADDVDFDKLPNQFVLKDTLGGGGISVIICKDKSHADLESYRAVMRKWTHAHTGKSFGREWVYEGRKHRIIAEKYIKSDESKGGLIDYKFFCFDGNFEFMYVISNRQLGGLASFGIYDKNFNRLPVIRKNENQLNDCTEKPSNFYEMVKIAENISEKFPEARVDLYSQNGKILFGEITFFSGSGYISFEPDSFDFEMGEKFDLGKYLCKY